MFPALSLAQSKKDRAILNSLQENISGLRLLSNDSASSSADYSLMAEHFKAIGLTPLPGHDYLQPVISNNGRKYTPGTTLFVNNKELEAGKDFFPLPYSAQGDAEGSPLIAVQEQNEPWIVDLANYSGIEPLPDSLVMNAMYTLAQKAVDDHAKAVLFYHSNKTPAFPPAPLSTNRDPLRIPIVYVNPPAAKEYFNDATASAHIKLQVRFTERKDTAYNVVGTIDNGAAQTLIIGGHNPADKAALISLGRLLKQDKRFTGKNYLLVSFAGIKNGLSGEQYFLEHPPVDFGQVYCFINMSHSPEADSLLTVTVSENTAPELKGLLDKMKSDDIIFRGDSFADYSNKVSCPVLLLSSGVKYADAERELKAIKFLDTLLKEINRKIK